MPYPLDGGTKKPYSMHMKARQFIRLLKKQGVKIREGRGDGSHVYVINPANGNRTTVPMHGKEIPKDFCKKICKQLGIDYDTL